MREKERPGGPNHDTHREESESHAEATKDVSTEQGAAKMKVVSECEISDSYRQRQF